jgi:hypothetical protein
MKLSEIELHDVLTSGIFLAVAIIFWKEILAPMV